MAIYFVTYDLRGDRDYGDLYDELSDVGAVRVLESTWCFEGVETSCEKVRDHLKQYIDSDDGLCVVKKKGWATYGAESTPNDLD